jgi:(p)ppGpp synthase/HD superfamily hydrolase
MINKAIKFATDAHAGQTDKSGLPYIFHPIRVASVFTEERHQVVAVLHDIIEDTDVGYLDLIREFGLDVADIVWRLSRRPHESYEAFVLRCKEHPVSRAVKIADILDNLRPGAEHLRARYTAALEELNR